jgi:hypothetical protein
LHDQIRGQGNQVIADLDHFDARHRQPQSRRHPRSKHFVRQYPNMLRIILEFYDVTGAVIAAHQVRLRAAAHATDMLYRQRHGSAC